MHKARFKRLIKAAAAGLLFYLLLYFIGMITFGALLLPIKSWTPEGNPHLVNTLHFMALAFSYAIYVYFKKLK